MANIQIGTNLRNCKITLAAEFYQPWGVLFSFQNNTTDVNRLISLLEYSSLSLHTFLILSVINFLIFIYITSFLK